MTTVVAAFDFDGTLTTRDTVVPFLRRFTSRSRFASGVLQRVLRLLPVAARRNRDELRAIATELVFAGRPCAEVERAATAHAAAIVAGMLRGDTVARLRWHVDEGHQVVIVSAGYEDYVRLVAAEWSVTNVLATRLEVVDDRCTGRLDGANCRGPEKVRRLQQWLADAGLERAAIELYAYGNSAGDRELLASADHPHHVGEPLASVAPIA